MLKCNTVVSSVVAGDQFLEHLIGCLEVEHLARSVVQAFGDRV